MPESPGVKADNQYKDNRKKYSQEQVFQDDPSLYKQRTRILERAEDARTVRESPHRYFDDMTYTQDYQANDDAALTYLRPKRNKADVRINTATSEKKLDAMLNEMLAMNIQPEVRAHDIFTDEEVQYLGNDITDAVVRTNQIEREDDMLEDTYRELISQRAVFIKEINYKKTVRSPLDKNKTYTVTRVEKRLTPGKKIYLGNINIPAYKFHEQPFIIEYDQIHYDNFRALFPEEDFPNAKYVAKGGHMSSSLEFDSKMHSEWRLNNVDKNMVEIVRYYSFVDNEYQVYASGVPMYKADEPLPYDWEGYNIKMIVVKPVHNFAYGKPPIASAKPLQSLENETIRNFVFKMRQALQPPLGTTNKKIFSKDIWNPAAVTQGITKNSFDKLVEHDGPTNSDFQMFQLINKITTEFIGVSDIQQGFQAPDRQTATANINQLRQSLKMMGYVIVAAQRVRIAATEMRIPNMFINLISKPQGKRLDPITKEVVNKYYGFTLQNTTLASGKKGTKRIMFMDRSLTEEEREKLKEEEDKLEKLGRPTQFRFINLKAFREYPLYFYISAVQKEKPGSALDKVLNQEKLTQAATIEQLSRGQVQANWPSLAEATSLSWNDREMFQTQAPQSLELMGTQQQPSEENAADPQQLQQVSQELNQLEGQLNNGSGVSAQLSEATRGQARVNQAMQQNP